MDHSVNEIKNAIDRALSPSFAQSISEIKNPYGDGDSASRIVDILEKIDLRGPYKQKDRILMNQGYKNVLVTGGADALAYRSAMN